MVIYVAAGFTVKNPLKVWSRRPRLLLGRTAGRGCSTFFILGDENFVFNERLAGANPGETLGPSIDWDLVSGFSPRKWRHLCR